MSGGIAIVGIACRYPDAASPDALWENVIAQRRAFRRLPDERLRSDDYQSPDRDAPDRTYIAQAAVLEGWDFDRVAFRVVGSTFRSADLAHWLSLDVSARALEDAGFGGGEGLPRESTGVVLGNTLTGEFSRANVMRLRWPYVRRVLEAQLIDEGWSPKRRAEFLRQMETQYKSAFPPIGEETLAGGLSNTIAGRICNHFDFKGGGYTVDGACAASLLSVSTACSSLTARDLDVAVAGGVDLSLDPFELVGFAKTGALAPDLMRIYDRRSAGFWPGEGCGMVVLMREEDAVARNCRVYAVVRGWGVSSDGGGGITRPTIDGQLLALDRAYRRAGFGVQTVSYFEGHGTGTAVGDANELRVLSTARREAGATALAAIGSIKANIGHTKAAAGIAGFIKATLAIDRELVPPTTGCEHPHPELTGDDAQLRILREPEPWPGPDRRVGVSAMGFGGINTHVTLEGPAPTRRTTVSAPERTLGRSCQDAELFLLRGPDHDDLARQVAHLLTIAGRLSMAELGDLARELARQPGDGPCRAAVVASRPAELEARLEELQALLGRRTASSIGEYAGVSVAADTSSPRIGLAFPGQGSPVRRDGGRWSRRFECVAELYDGLTLPESDDDVSTLVAQPAIVAASAAAVRVLARLGITGTAAIGHSLGEISALGWAGACDEAAMLRIATARGRAMSELGSPTGAMASVSAGPDEVGGLIDGTALVISGLNGPRSTVVSGESGEIDRLIERATASGHHAVRVPVSHAFHSSLVEAATPALTAHLHTESLAPLTGRVVSTVTGSTLAPETDVTTLLRDQIVSPVRFTQAATVLADDVDLIIEAGPGHVLSRLLREFVAPPVISLDAGGESLVGLLEAVGAAWALGAEIDPSALFDDRFLRPFDLDWQPSFLASPCERAPIIEGEAHRLHVAPLETVAEAASDTTGGLADVPDLDDTASAIEVVRALVAHRAELPAAAVSDGDRFLSDLHLNSITVGQMVTEAARRLGRQPPAAPTEYADATIAEAAAALEELAELGEHADAPERAPAGVDTWVRALTVEMVERPRPNRAAPDGRGAWRVLAPDGHPFAQRLERSLAESVPTGGVAVCMPREIDLEHAGLLLEAGQTVLRHRENARFVVVQHDGGAASFARTLHLEAPRITTCVVDVPEDHAEIVAWVTGEAAAAAGYVEVRYDQTGRRLVPQLRALEIDDTPDLPLDESDVLLVTGGGKGIAAESALEIARRTGLTLVLMGRSTPDADAELRSNLERLRTHGVRFHYVAADVTDAAAVTAGLAEARAEAGHVTAFIHGAGTNVPQLIGALDTMAVRRTVAPKIHGAENVLAALDPDRLRLFVTLSSIIARIGLHGQGDYALANEWLTRLTERWQAAHPRCRCLALESSVWSGVGMGQRVGHSDTLEHLGVSAIPPDLGIDFLIRLMSVDRPEVATVLTSRFGPPPTVRLAGDELPLRRFLERPRVHYPGIELVVDSTISADTDLYVDDHVLHEERLVPAVIAMEAMVQVATALAGEPVVTALEHVGFNRPIVVPPGGDVTIRVAAVRRESGEVDVVVRSGETSFQVDHFRATCRFDALAPAAPAPASAVSSNGEPLLPVDPQDELYGGILFHSGRFMRLRGYRRLAARSCVAEIAPDGASRWFAQFLPDTLLLGDPAVRDTAIHAIQACIPHARLIPIGVDRITPVVLPRSEACVVHAVERSRDGDTFTYDMEVCDEAGSVCERWEGLILRAVEPIRPSRAWAEPLLVPYLERRTEELIPGTRTTVAVEYNGVVERRERSDAAIRHAVGEDVDVVRRADGRPEVAGADAPDVSVAHAGQLTLAVAGTGAVGCDVEAVVARPAADWHAMLSGDRYELVDLITRATGEDADTAATRIWAAGECLTKTQAPSDAPLTLESSCDDGWIVLASGRIHIATYAAPVRSAEQPHVFAVLASEPDASI